MKEMGIIYTDTPIITDNPVDPLVMRLPAMTDELIWILGRPNFACAGIANVLRGMGQEIKEKSEDEQAAAIYWMLNIYLEHGEGWREVAQAILKQGA